MSRFIFWQNHAANGSVYVLKNEFVSFEEQESKEQTAQKAVLEMMDYNL